MQFTVIVLVAGRSYPAILCFTPGDKTLEAYQGNDKYYLENVLWEVESVVDEVGRAGEKPHMVLVKWKVRLGGNERERL
jgi:hypothetical protein